MKKLLLFLSFSLIVVGAWCQQGTKPLIRLDLSIKNFITQERIRTPVTITVLNYHTINNTYKTDSSGRIKISLELDRLYEIRIEQEGMLRRNLIFDTRYIPSADIYANGWDIPVDMPLVAKDKIANCSLKVEEMEKMITSTLAYNSISGDLDWNMADAERMRKIFKECTVQ